MTPLGRLEISTDGEVITGLRFVRKSARGSSKTASARERELIAACKKQLGEYFQGLRQTFDLPLRAQGTAFQQDVWKELKRLPYGVVTSYKVIAGRLKKLGAARAVGQANNKNPLPILVPCHRVVGVSGKPVGYACGISRQKWLLQHEEKNFFLTNSGSK